MNDDRTLLRKLRANYEVDHPPEPKKPTLLKGEYICPHGVISRKNDYCPKCLSESML